jgi:hypothetical protein
MEEGTLSQTLCDLAKGRLPPVSDLLEHSFEELGNMVRVAVSLDLLEERALTLLLEAVVLSLGGDSEARLREMAGEAAEADCEEWALSEEQRAIRYPPHKRRLALVHHILCEELGDPSLATRSLSLLPLPGTELGRLAQWLSLSSYMLQAIYDFGVVDPPDIRLLYIVCTNPEVVVVNSAAVALRCTEGEYLRRLLREKTKELMRHRRRGEMGREEMDALMVHHFLGWAKTYTGHVVYVYYRGPSSRTERDMSRAENWRLLKGDFLRFFHTRVGKDLSRFMALNSSDVTEGVDGHRNPLVDVRFLVSRWCKKNPRRVELICEHATLLERKGDLLESVHVV